MSDLLFDALAKAEREFVTARESVVAALQSGDAARAERDGAAMRKAWSAVVEARAQVQREETAARLYTWRPPHAAHVVGTWTPRSFDAKGLPKAQVVSCRCEACGAAWEVPCTSGLVRQKVQAFALAHLHRDVLATRKHAP